MAKLDMIFVVGSAVARARVQRRLTQQDLAAAYKRFLEGHLDEYPSASFLDNGRISSIEGSRPGEVVGPRNLVPSRVKRQTATVLAQLLGVPTESITEELPAVVVDIANLSPIFATGTTLAPNIENATLVGTLATLPSVELPFISAAARASFAELGATVPFRLTHECRRVYLRGQPATMYEGRVVFEVANDSMEPYLNAGDEVVAVPVPEGRWDTLLNCIAVVSYEGSHGASYVTIKKIIQNDLMNRGTLTLLPYRNELAAFVIHRSQISSLHVVEYRQPRCEAVTL